MSVPMKPDDPAYWMLLDEHTTTPVEGLYRASCYICRDPEFAQMGLPLCYPCPKCNGHVPADDTVCTDCKHEVGPEDYEDNTQKIAQEDNVLDLGWKANMVDQPSLRPPYNSAINTMLDGRTLNNNGSLL